MEYIKVEVGRVDKPLVKFTCKSGDTVADLLVLAELEVVKGERIKNFDDEVFALTDVLVDGETYFLVGDLEQGAY